MEHRRQIPESIIQQEIEKFKNMGKIITITRLDPRMEAAEAKRNRVLRKTFEKYPGYKYAVSVATTALDEATNPDNFQLTVVSGSDLVETVARGIQDEQAELRKIFCKRDENEIAPHIERMQELRRASQNIKNFSS